MPRKEPKPEFNDIVNVPVPDRRVFDAPMAQMICDSAYLAYAKYHSSIFNMMEQFDGLLPHDPAYLEEAGCSWISNVPYRKGWSQIEKASINRTNMLRSAILFSSACFRPYVDGDEKKPENFYLFNPALRTFYASRLTRILIDTIRRDPCFLRDFILKIAYNQVTWGLAISEVDDKAVFPHVPEILNCYFERANRKENIKFYIRVFWQRPDDLYRLYKEEEERGWENSYYIKEGLEEALQWALERQTTQTYQSWQVIVRTYDAAKLSTMYGESRDQITWAWIWNEETRGGVTKTLYRWNRGLINHGAYDELGGARNLWGDNTMPNGSYLSYQFYDEDLKLQDIWRIYPNTGMTNTDIAQDLRGLGGYAYELDISNNIKRNALNDSMTVRLPIMFQPQFGAQQDAMNQFNIVGGIAQAPMGLAPMRDLGNTSVLRDAVQLIQFEEAEYAQDTSQYNPQVAGNLTDRATNEQVQAVSAEVQRQRSDFATVPLDALAAELLAILHRLGKDYKEDDYGYDPYFYFKNRVKNDIWPLTGQKDLEEPAFTFDKFFKSLIENVDYVSLDYSTNDVMALQQLVQSTQVPEGKTHFLRKLAFALGASYDEIVLYWPYQDSPDLNINDSSLSLIENYMFWDTGEVAYNPLQNAVTHLQNHFAKAMELLQGVQKGMDPLTIWKWYSNMLPHAERHLQQLSQDPYEVQNFEAFSDTYRELLKVSDQLAGFAQQQASEINAQRDAQQAQNPQNGLPPETVAKLQALEVTTQQKMQRQAKQSEQKFRFADERQQQNLRFAEERHNQQMQAQARTAALQLVQQEQQGER